MTPENARAKAVLEFADYVQTLVAEIVDGSDDIQEVIWKVRGIEEQGTQLIERLTDILREQTEDDREVSVPPTDMTWVR